MKTAVKLFIFPSVLFYILAAAANVFGPRILVADLIAIYTIYILIGAPFALLIPKLLNVKSYIKNEILHSIIVSFLFGIIMNFFYSKEIKFTDYIFGSIINAIFLYFVLILSKITTDFIWKKFEN